MRAVVVLFLFVSGCRGQLVFPCTNSGQCLRAGMDDGQCVGSMLGSTKYCAFKDVNCDSKLRFDSSAGDGLAGQCMGAGGGDGFLSVVDFANDNADLVGTPPPADMTGQPAALTWTPISVGTTSNVYCVAGYDKSHIFIGGVDGIFYSLDAGKTWSKQVLAGNAGDIVSIWSTKAGTWGVGWYSEIFHVTGDSTTWERQTPPVPGMGNYYGIWGYSASNLFVVGLSGVVLHSSDGKNWIVQNSGLGGGALNSVWGSSSLEVWSVGGSSVLGAKSPIIHSASMGSQWAIEPSPTDAELFRVWGSSGTDLYAVGEQNIVLRSGGGGWSISKKANGNNKDAYLGLWGTSANDVYIAGTGGALSHSTDGGKSWTDLNSGTASNLVFIWGSGPEDVWVVGNGGAVIHGTR